MIRHQIMCSRFFSLLDKKAKAQYGSRFQRNAFFKFLTSTGIIKFLNNNSKETFKMYFIKLQTYSRLLILTLSRHWEKFFKRAGVNAVGSCRLSPTSAASTSLTT